MNDMETKIKTPKASEKSTRVYLKQYLFDIFTIIVAGSVVALAYHFFQNSNNFAPGGVGGLATITYALLGKEVSWSILMLAFNIPIFLLVSILVDKKLGIYLSLYMIVQSLGVDFLEWLGAKPYCLATSGADFEVTFACIATGVVSGLGFSLMLKRFGASGGTYAISALIRRFKPTSNIAHLAFILDSSVVFIAFFVYGMNITPVICTLINVFIANVVVDTVLSGAKNGYRFEIITNRPDEIAQDLLSELGHGVTQIEVQGKYSHDNKSMLVCIIRKRQIGQMLKILNRYPNTFSSFSKTNEVWGRFKK